MTDIFDLPAVLIEMLLTMMVEILEPARYSRTPGGSPAKPAANWYPLTMVSKAWKAMADESRCLQNQPGVQIWAWSCNARAHTWRIPTAVQLIKHVCWEEANDCQGPMLQQLKHCERLEISENQNS